MKDNYTSNLDLWAKEQGFRAVIGVDEAGRGPWAGPVTTAAVLLSDPHQAYQDSKKLSEAKREKLFLQIPLESRAYSIQESSSARIDEINILQATLEAMKRAVLEVIQKCPEADCVIVDGKQSLSGLSIPCYAFPKADGRAHSVAAASILAKVTRDRFMISLGEKYPQYQFAKHKGYGSALHQELLQKYGPCPEHRRSFAPIQEALRLLPKQPDFFK